MQNVAFFFAMLIATGTYAMLRGGAPERLAVVVLVASAVVDGAIVASAPAVFLDREPAILMLDFATFAAITALALRAERVWPMCMAAFLLVGVELQLGVWAAPEVHRQIYKLAHAYSAYPTLAVLAVGVFRHRRRTSVRRERAWTVFHRRRDVRAS